MVLCSQVSVHVFDLLHSSLADAFQLRTLSLLQVIAGISSQTRVVYYVHGIHSSGHPACHMSGSPTCELSKDGLPGSVPRTSSAVLPKYCVTLCAQIPNLAVFPSLIDYCGCTPSTSTDLRPHVQHFLLEIQPRTRCGKNKWGRRLGPFVHTGETPGLGPGCELHLPHQSSAYGSNPWSHGLAVSAGDGGGCSRCRNSEGRLSTGSHSSVGVVEKRK